MAQALESVDRGRDTVQALRLAQALQPRDDTALALDDAIGKYGFRITETTVRKRQRPPAHLRDLLGRPGRQRASTIRPSSS